MIFFIYKYIGVQNRLHVVIAFRVFEISSRARKWLSDAEIDVRPGKSNAAYIILYNTTLYIKYCTSEIPNDIDGVLFHIRSVFFVFLCPNAYYRRKPQSSFYSYYVYPVARLRDFSTIRLRDRPAAGGSHIARWFALAKRRPFF